MSRNEARIIRADRATSVTAALILIFGVSGCAELRLDDSDVNRIATQLGSTLPLTICSGAGGAGGPKTIDIHFEQKGALWCPKAQVETCPQTYRNKVVKWRAVELDNNGAWQPIPIDYTVYFSPFPSGSVSTHPPGGGITTPINVQNSAPEGVFKYSVVPDTVTADCQPLDPIFWVNQ